MRKRLSRNVCLVIMILATMLCLGACNEIQKSTKLERDSEAVLKAKIVQINNTTILLASMDSNEGTASLYTVNRNIDLYVMDNKGNRIKDGQEQLAIGMEVEIGYDGTILETYPVQINGEYIAITDKGDNLIEMYLEVLDMIINEDKGLNENITIMGFDLSQVDNLTESEKSAIAYIIGNEYGMESIQGTYEELCLEGYIDKDKLYFENGILLKLKVSDLSDDKFTFSVSKWRGGDGAIGSDNCTATRNKDVWTYEVGGMWIS